VVPPAEWHTAVAEEKEREFQFRINKQEGAVTAEEMAEIQALRAHDPAADLLPAHVPTIQHVIGSNGVFRQINVEVRSRISLISVLHCVPEHLLTLYFSFSWC
jgi:hypothetical protein